MDSNYVITLDKLSAEIINKILKNTNLKEQIKEWQMLGMVDNNFSFNKRLEEHKYLPIDTKYFKNLELEILSLFDNLDEALDGRLINSENYQALNTLKDRYKEKIQCIYIDPPFNTGSDFIFLDSFQDSTWISILNDRLRISKDFLKDTGSIYLHLDHIAEHYGRELLDLNYGKNNFRAKITWNTGDNISGFKAQAQNWIRQADFIHFYTKSNKYKFHKINEILNEKEKLKFGWLDIVSKDKDNKYIEYWDNNTLTNKIVNYKTKPKGTIWNDIFSFMYSESRETESLSFVSNQKPENLLRRIIQSSTDKKDYILDFFAGSATTAAVAHKLNRKYIIVELGDFFNEFYFDIQEIKNEQLKNSIVEDIISSKEKTTIVKLKKIGILGRMKNVIKGDKKFKVSHSKLLREPHLSKDINWQGGGFFKYYKLEQYENTLDKVNYNEKTPQIIFDFKKPFENYIFQTDAKLSDVLKVKDNTADINFDNMYKNIDFAETISLITGKAIKKITKTGVLLENEKEEIKTDYKNMTNEEKIEFIKLLKPLLWWGK